MFSTRLAAPIVLIALLALVLASCTSAPAAAPTEPAAAPAASEPTAAATNTPLPPPTATPEPAAEPQPTEPPTPTSEPAAAATATPVAPTATPEPELTLAETLAAAFSAAPTAAGEVILVTGQVLDLAGNPLPGAAVEFWQTDASGVYDHPGDRGTAGRDRGFQFYGTSIADADGRYAFRTVQPGYYEPRPRHIHVKVKLDGRTLLTTQFYFAEDRTGAGEALTLREIDRIAMGGAPVAVLARDLVVNTGSAGSLAATPAQGEGPYYPVVSVANFDSDLAAVP